MAATNARRLAMFVLIAVVANGSLSCAQGRDEVPPGTALVLEQMMGAAGVVFAGEVISVRQPEGFAGSARDAAEGFVSVRFRVDEAVRGCAGVPVYTLREWAGLWTGGERYRVGQRLLVFLRSPDANGLSTTVHGMAGALPLGGGGVAPGPYDASAGAADWVVDLRWVEAQAMRGTTESRAPVSDPIARTGRRPVSETAGSVSDGVVVLRNPDSTDEVAQPVLLPVADVFAHRSASRLPEKRPMPSLARVLSLCREWAGSADASQ